MSATSTTGTNNLSWMIGGAQGSGVDSSANVFSRACVLAGLWVYGTREYYSNIKGLHSYFEVRVSDRQIRSKIEEVDLLATFDAETLIRHAEAVRPGGGIIYNPSLVRTEIGKVDTLEDNVVEKIIGRLASQRFTPNVSGLLDEAKRREIQLFPISYDQVISKTGQKIGESQLSKLSRIINVLAVSASMSVLGLDVKYLEKAIEAIFGAKKKVIEMNVVGARLVYDVLNGASHTQFPAKLVPRENARPRMFVAGNQAVALGKLVGGCRMQTYYPITPASDESEFLESHENFSLVGDADGKGSIVVVQTEDEIAAITMATGAALTGTRASTSTSGPGFSLMVEGMGWAGINEVPVVITLYSRGGPSTGMPTRNEQGDLQFALHASHGEFPRIVLSSGDMEECFYDAIRIFNYAEKYQCPAIHMVDKALANSNMTILPFSSEKVPIERGKLIQNAQVPLASGEPYKRFKFTDDGISPRAVLGLKGYRFWNTGDEHSEIGHIDEDPENRIRMMTKRMTKLETAAKEIPDSEKVNFFPASKGSADATIVSWGSSKGAILEAMELLRGDGIDVEFLQLRLMSPFPADFVKKILSNSKLIVDIEQNYSGQLAALIAEKTQIEIKNKILKFNGRPVSRDEIYDSVRQVIKAPLENRRIVLVHGA